MLIGKPIQIEAKISYEVLGIIVKIKFIQNVIQSIENIWRDVVFLPDCGGLSVDWGGCLCSPSGEDRREVEQEPAVDDDVDWAWAETVDDDEDCGSWSAGESTSMVLSPPSSGTAGVFESNASDLTMFPAIRGYTLFLSTKL